MASNSKPGPSSSVSNLPYSCSYCKPLSRVDGNVPKVEYVMQNLISDPSDVAKEKLRLLSTICEQDLWFKNVLLEGGIQDILECIIENNDSGVTACALLLLVDLYTEEKHTYRMLRKTSTDFIKRVLELYTCFSVVIFQKCCLTIMVILTQDVQPRKIMYSQGIGEKMFEVLDKSIDRELQKQTLVLFLHLLRFDELDLFLMEPEKLNLGILLHYLNDIFPPMQDVVIESLLRLAHFNNDVIKQSMIDHDVVLTMFSIVMDASSRRLHLGAEMIILKSINSSFTCKHIVQTKEFKKFLEFMEICSDKCAVFAARVIVCLSEDDDLLETLHDLNVENGVLSLLRFKDAMTNYEIVSFANNIAKHRRLFNKLLCADLVKSMINLVIVPVNQPLYRSVGLSAIHSFLKTDSSMINLMYKVDKDCQLVSVFNNNMGDLNEEMIELLLRIFEKCSISGMFRQRFQSESFCRRLLQYFAILDDMLSPAAMDVMKLFVYDEAFLEHFVCWNGPTVFVRKILCTAEQPFLEQIFEFIYHACALENVCLDFINEKLHICLDNLNPNIREMKIVGKVMDKLCDVYLPLKFHRKGRIEVEEFIDTGFYAITGTWLWDFPLLNDITRYPISEEYTVYLVDYSAHPLFGNIDALPSAKEQRRQKRISKCLQKRFRKRGVSKEPSLATIPETNEISVESYRCVKKTNSVYYKSISQDLNLPEKLEAAWKKIRRMKNKVSVKEKVAALARYVEMTTSGFCDYEDENDPEYLQAYLNHIRELKVERESNVIPIGFVKCGRGIERAILFKTLADKIGLLASLVRGSNGFMWNEVPINMSVKEYIQYEKSAITFGIVDLIKDVGKVMPFGSMEADMYVGESSNVKFFPRKVPFLHCK